MSIYSLTDEQRAATAAAVATANNGKTAASGTGLEGDFSFFLKMLTTQLQNQDPTEPMDTTQMTQQIAQYTGVEQQVKTNTQLEKLLSQNKQSQIATAVSYIGKEVETQGNSGTLNYYQSGETIAGQAAFSYVLPSTAGSVSITITNEAGAAVFQGQGTTKAGRNVVVWDGINSFTGVQMDPGVYTINVTAKSASGAAMTADTRAVGVVDTVETDANGDIVLNVGQVQVKYSEILAVREQTLVNIPSSSGSETTAENGTSSDSGTESAS
jgi:flagellar basal-body rod modification protein FlgD